MFSFEVGVAKPDPAIYLEAARRLRVDVSETCFIGDGADEELAGAERAGLHAIRALWFLRRWPHFRDEPYGGPSAVAIEDIVSLVEREA